MDFSYKVIKNRLGSLVANAIQKKTKEEINNVVKVKFTFVGSGSFGWYRSGNMNSNTIYEIDDIRVVSGASTSNINVFVIGWHTIVKQGDFWVHDSSKIEGTTGSTVISDSILLDLVKKDILDVKYFITPNLQSLTVFEMHSRSITAAMVIDGYPYKVNTNQMQTLLTQ